MTKESEIRISRRNFFKVAAIGTAVGIGAALIPETANAQESAPLPCAPGTREVNGPLAISGVLTFLVDIPLLITLYPRSGSLREAVIRSGIVAAGDGIFFGIGYVVGRGIESATGTRLSWCIPPKKK